MLEHSIFTIKANSVIHICLCSSELKQLLQILTNIHLKTSSAFPINIFKHYVLWLKVSVNVVLALYHI